LIANLESSGHGSFDQLISAVATDDVHFKLTESPTFTVVGVDGVIVSCWLQADSSKKRYT